MGITRVSISDDWYYRAFVSFNRLYGTDPTWRRGLRYLKGTVSALWKARRHGSRYAIFHIFSYGPKEAFSVWAARLLGLKVVLILHDIESFGQPSARTMRQIMLAGTDKCIVHNAFSLRELTSLVPSMADKAIVAPHGHYIDAFPDPMPRQAARSQLALPQDRFIALFFGNSRIEKGLDLLLEAVADTGGQEEFLLLVAGKMKPQQEELYRAVAERSGSSDRVRFDIKFVSDEEALAYYAASDLVVVPYRKVYESGVTIMAMSLGRAVLVSNLEPLMESIGQREAGMVFQSDDSAALTEALRKAMHQRGSLDSVGETGRSRVRELRDWQAIGHRILDGLAGQPDQKR